MKLPQLSVSRRGVLVGLIQLALVGSLGGKLWYDRATLPRVWARCAGVDPDDPLRGRYIDVRLAVPFTSNDVEYGFARLRIQRDQLIAEPAEAYSTGGSGQVTFAGRIERGGRQLVLVDPPLSVFLPEHMPDPTLRKIDEELWIEVTLPREGPPRPIHLGIKRANAEIVPLSLD